MDLLSLGTQLNTVRNLNALKYERKKNENTLWKRRVDAGHYEKMAESDPELASMQEYIDKLNADAGTLIERLAGSAPVDLEVIHAKLQAGQKLSGSELQKLKQADPEAYAKAVQIEAERQAYERRLKQCKTKEDVQRLRLTNISNVAARVSSIANNPNIPEDKKLEMVTHEHNRAAAINEATNEFARTAEYAALDTEAERNAEQKAERKRRDAQRAQAPESVEKAEQEAEETPKPAEDAGQTDAAEQTGAVLAEKPDFEPIESQYEAPESALPNTNDTDASAEKTTDKHVSAKVRDAYKESAFAGARIRKRK